MSRALTTARRERNRVAWNLPRPSVASEPQEALDWSGFRARYFPDSRRHDLRALTAYATYLREDAPDDASLTGASPVGLGEWEDDGGSTRGVRGR